MGIFFSNDTLAMPKAVEDNETDKLDPKWGEPSSMHDPYILSQFEARPTDVLITTAPKAGTTWMQQILYQLRSGGDDSFNAIDEVIPWLERPRQGRTSRDLLLEYEAIPDPRVFKTHCTYTQTPGVTVVRIILSSRDPRDCCVSFYHHVMDMTDEARERVGAPAPQSFDEYFEKWMSFGAWYRNVQSWWPYHSDPNVLWLRYEDMKNDLPHVIERILRFLGWSLTVEQRIRVLEYCSFPWMKANAHKFTRLSDMQRPIFKPGGFIRKGQIGDYKTLLSISQEKAIFDRARETLEPSCLEFLGIPL